VQTSAPCNEAHLDDQLGVEAVEGSVCAVRKGPDGVGVLALRRDEARDLRRERGVAAVLQPVAVLVLEHGGRGAVVADHGDGAVDAHADARHALHPEQRPGRVHLLPCGERFAAGKHARRSGGPHRGHIVEGSAATSRERRGRAKVTQRPRYLLPVTWILRDAGSAICEDGPLRKQTNAARCAASHDVRGINIQLPCAHHKSAFGSGSRFLSNTRWTFSLRSGWPGGSGRYAAVMGFLNAALTTAARSQRQKLFSNAAALLQVLLESLIASTWSLALTDSHRTG